MSHFPDTSFLCALYREQANSPAARHWYDGLPGCMEISPAVAFEFRQSIRLQVFLNARDRTKGFGPKEARHMFDALEADISLGAVAVVSADWPAVLVIAERVSEGYTVQGGHRSWDVLHVATALHHGARTLLSFDGRQRILATANGLAVGP